MAHPLQKQLTHQTEAQFLAAIIRLATIEGWLTAHFRPGATAKGWRTPVQGQAQGFPDLVLARPPRLIIAELKVRGSLTPTQRIWQATLPACTGIEYYLWRPTDWPTILETLNYQVAADHPMRFPYAPAIGEKARLPSTEQMSGSDPDLTGRLTTAEFLRDLRDG